jgi:hypothetical protein
MALKQSDSVTLSKQSSDNAIWRNVDYVRFEVLKAVTVKLCSFVGCSAV